MTTMLDSANTELTDVENLLNQTTESIFLTGKAGTGKSTFIRNFSNRTSKKHISLAPTGLAALNVGGQTIHSFFKLPIRPLLPEDRELKSNYSKLFNRTQRRLIENLDLIIIDEVSMVRSDIIDAMDLLLRCLRRCSYLPFGGVQMLFVGDLYQIEPVVPPRDLEVLRNFYPSFYFFNARVFQNKPLISIELTHVYRQTDTQFVELLDRIRLGQPTTGDLQRINQRCTDVSDKVVLNTEDVLSIILTTRRDRAFAINNRYLDALPGQEVTIHGKLEGDFPVHNLPTEEELVLKEGAQVIFVSNDSERNWVNGTLGVVEHINIDEEVVYVRLENGETVEVTPYEWTNKRYSFNSKKYTIEEEVLGSFAQIPLKTAWAITIHKSQGLTFDYVHLDLASGAFAKGQTYVALSRCRTLEGLSLYQKLTSYDLHVSKEVEAFYRQTNNREQIQDALEKAHATTLLLKASKLWNSRHYEEATSLFLEGISQAPSFLQDEKVKRLIRSKTVDYSILKRKNFELEKEINSQKSLLSGLAREYVEMGQMCVEMDVDPVIALKNYDKALSLDPGYLPALCAKVDVLIKQNEADEALLCARKAVERAPASAVSKITLGKAFIAKGDLREAIPTLLTAISIDAKNRTAFLLLIDIYDQLGEEDKADRLRRLLPE